MRRLIPFLLTLGAMAGGSRSWAAVDDFEDIGPNRTAVVTRVIDGVTVTISTTQGSSLEAATYLDTGSSYAFDGDGAPNKPLTPGNLSGTRFISTSFGTTGDPTCFGQVGPIVFTFSAPVYSFGLTTLDVLEDVADNATVRLQAFDGGNNLVAEHVRAGSQGPSGLDLDWAVTSGGLDIMKVLLVFSSGTISCGYGIDDLDLVPVAVSAAPTTWGRIKLQY